MNLRLDLDPDDAAMLLMIVDGYITQKRQDILRLMDQMAVDANHELLTSAERLRNNIRQADKQKRKVRK